jgi:hypothetical protein
VSNFATSSFGRVVDVADDAESDDFESLHAPPSSAIVITPMSSFPIAQLVP